MKQNKYLIIYHREDNDGVFSGAISKYYLMKVLNIKNDDIDIYGADYNMLKNVDVDRLNEYTNIIITDISFDAETMIRLYNTFNKNFIWLDHHAPIINELSSMGGSAIAGSRIPTRSAILNVYKYFFDPKDEQYNNNTLPEIFRMLSAWDSFSFDKEGYTKEQVYYFNTGVTNKYNLDFDEVYAVVEKIMNGSSFYTETIIKTLSDSGKTFCDAIEKQNERILSDYGQVWHICNGDRTAAVLFLQGASNSEMFKSVKETCDNGLVFKHLSNGNWTISLYNTNNDDSFHCGNYLKEHYNGGGHVGASGATLTQEQFIQCLINKTI